MNSLHQIFNTFRNSGIQQRLIRTITTMAAETEATILSRLQANSERANSMIENLKRQTKSLRQQSIAAETEHISQENDELRESVKRLQTQLLNAQIQNGSRHGPYETPRSPEVPPPTEKKTTPSVSNHVPSTTETGKMKQTQPESKKKSKEQNESKKAGGESADLKMDVSQLDFRIGQIVSVKRHPDAEGLYIEDIDVGEDKTRTVVSGLVKHVSLEEMQDRIVVVICNLKPAKLRGTKSEAMVMCASTPDKVELLTPPTGSVPGDRVSFEGYSGPPYAQLNPKKKIFETLQPHLNTDADKVATYKGIPFSVEGRGVCTAPTMANSPIK